MFKNIRLFLFQTENNNLGGKQMKHFNNFYNLNSTYSERIKHTPNANIPMKIEMIS